MKRRRHTGEGCSVLGFTCSYVRMGGTHASSDFFSWPTSPGFPPEAGDLAADEFRRTYFGSCRAGASVLLEARRERRRECVANVLESIEVVVTNRCKHPSPSFHLVRSPQIRELPIERHASPLLVPLTTSRPAPCQVIPLGARSNGLRR